MKLNLMNKKVLAIFVVVALASTMLLVSQAMIESEHPIFKPYTTNGPTVYEYDTLDLIPDGNIFGDMGLKTFSDFDDYQGFVGKTAGGQPGVYWAPGVDNISFERVDDNSGSSASMAIEADGGASHSKTNVQVDGVDEGDIVKNDDSHAYIVSNNRDSVFIVKVYPTGDAKIESQILVDGYIQEIYITGDKLIIISQAYYFEGGWCGTSYQYSDDSEVQVKIYDVSNKTMPSLSSEEGVMGIFSTSRLINNYLYLIATKGTYSILNETDLPIPVDCIHYFNEPDNSYNINTFMAMNIHNDSNPTVSSIVMGAGQNIYFSENSIFITYTIWEQIDDEYSLVGWSTGQKTAIHRISIDNRTLKYEGNNEVTGTVLNRFSMDEHNGYFRIATTVGWGEKSQVHILDSQLNHISTLDNIAPGEEIYSARFMGDRAFLVTFFQTDPFFVIDLADVDNPKILGELKIPGYSDYLHPYDENHVIGLGKEQSGTNWRWSVKIALFDVTNVTNPIELDNYLIGDYGSQSAATYDPHAFMFSLEKNLLVIPVTVNAENNYYWDYEEYTPPWVGAHAFEISPENGITLEGQIEHDSDVSEPDVDYYSYYYSIPGNEIQRSFYIGDTLYTVSGSMIKGNSIGSYDEVMKIEFES